MRVGVFGGTFDPIHYGHLLLAETCREQCDLDQVWLLPANVPPHKQQHRLTPVQHRLAMLQLAVAGHEAFVVSELEIQRGGVSYTVDTLSAILQQEPAAELYLLMGADSLNELPTWHRAARICELAVPIVVRRRGEPEPDFGVLSDLVSDARLGEIRQQEVQMPLFEYSSTEIRQLATAGRSIRYRTTRAVEQYIKSNGLYAPMEQTT